MFQEVRVKEEPLENFSDPHDAETAWEPELSVKGELEAGPESLPQPDGPFTDTDVKPPALFELFEDCGTTVQPRNASVKLETSDGAASDGVSATFGHYGKAGAGAPRRSTRLERRATDAPHQCQICLITLQKKSTLTKHIKETHTNKIKANAHTCETCGKRFTSKRNLLRHTQIHKNIPKTKIFVAYPCPVCCKQFGNKRNLRIHVREHSEHEPQSKICDKQFTQESQLSTEFRVRPGQKFYTRVRRDKGLCNSENGTTVNTCEESFCCDICNGKFKEKSQLITHIKIHSISGHDIDYKPYECETCKKQFEFKEYMLKHTIRAHAGEGLFSGDNRLEYKKNVLKHVKLVNPANILFPCEKCHITFRKKSSLTRHMKVHEEKVYDCVQCKKKFISIPDLERHKTIHAKNGPYLCEICGKEYDHKTRLNAHIKIHTGKKPFVCKICAKTFIENKQLNAHVKRHAREKLHGCEQCDERFARICAVKRHVKHTHTGEKNYSCPMCDKRFSRKDNLKVHIRIHTGDKPFSCDICKKQFTYKSLLPGHMLKHARKAPV